MGRTPKVLPMDVSQLLQDLYGRIPPLAADAVDGLDADQLCRAPAPGANTIGWLVWHLARVQDHHGAELLGDRAGLGQRGLGPVAAGSSPIPPTPATATSDADVHAVRPDGPDALLGYLAAVGARTRDPARGLPADDLDRVVDRRWDPPVTLGVRLVSIADDGLQHVGQAAYVRGLLGY